MAEAYPLCWPVGWKRTAYRSSSKFKTSFTKSHDLLFDELRRMGAKKPILSSNLNLRRDGLPLANQRNPQDPGAAVYFSYKPKGAKWNDPEKQMVLACDHYLKVEENIYAIAKTIEALRGIERWGASDMMERAFTGFAALPSEIPVKRSWRDVLGLSNLQRPVTREDVDAAYKLAALGAHPDRGGSTEAMSAINVARDEAMREFANRPHAVA